VVCFLNVAGVTHGLGNFAHNSEGVPVADIVGRDGEDGVVPLITSEAMRWMDLCIGKFPMMPKSTAEENDTGCLST